MVLKNLLVAVAGVALLAGCGNAAASTPAAHASVSAAPAAKTDSVPAVKATPAPDAGTVTPAHFTGPAVLHYGSAAVEAAYAELANFSLTQTFDTKVLATEMTKLTPADLAGPKAYMTPVAAKSWDASVAKRHTDQGTADLAILDTYGATSNGFRVRTDVAQTSLHQRVSEAKVSLDTDGRLVLVFRTRGDVRAYDPKGKPILMHANKVVTYYLIQNASADKPWLIDGWQGNFYGSQPSPDTK